MWPFTVGGMTLMPDTWKSIHPWARGVDYRQNKASVYDTIIEYDPWYRYAQECLKQGRVPHWNPWQFCGVPLYANRLVPFFYPPFILAELVSSPQKLISWFQFFNLILSGWGMYLLLRRWNLSPPVATVSSCLYLTCGLHFLPFPLFTLGTIGFPWLIWSLEWFLENPGLKPVAAAGLIAGLILMVGYPILIVHFTYFTFLYFIARWWGLRRLGPRRLHWTIPILTFALIYTLGFGIAAIANLPTITYTHQTFRNIAGFSDPAYNRERLGLLTSREEAGMDPIAVRFGERSDTLLLPRSGRGTQRAWRYGGSLIYLLAFLGILAGRPQARLLGILWLLFAVPVWIPEIHFQLMSFLPGWRLTIILPFAVVNLIACLLASFGLETLITANPRLNLFGKLLFALIAATAIALVWRANPALFAQSRFFHWYVLGFIAIAIGCCALVLIPAKTRWPGWLATAFILAVSLETFWYLQPVYSPANYMPSTPFTDWLEANVPSHNSDSAGNRLARRANLPVPFNPHRRMKSPFIPNIQMEYGVMDIGGYDSLVPSRYINYCDLFENAFMEYRALIAFRAGSTMSHFRLRDLGVRWIMSMGELPVEGREGCTLVWDDRYQGNRAGTDASDDFIQVWEVQNPEPRAFLTRKIAFISDPADDPLVLGTNLMVQGIRDVVIEDPSHENRTFAFLDSANPGAPLPLPGSEAKFETDLPEHLILNVSTPEDCYLVLRDGWYPEWLAFVDGSETPIYPADAAFRAIRISQGNHTVEFRYDPKSFRTGAWISAGALLLILALFVYSPGGKTRYIKPTASNL
jgi:hypothetical protein